MPRGSSGKRERQFDNIKESYQARGQPEEKADELAARTVNKQRRASGEMKQKGES